LHSAESVDSTPQALKQHSSKNSSIGKLPHLIQVKLRKKNLISRQKILTSRYVA
jgi:hypothetical protein